MQKDPTPIAVASRSFSKHPVLREELKSKYANVTFNDAGISLKGRDLVQFLQGAVKAITALETIDEPILSKLPELKVISKYGVGIDMLDLRAFKKFGVQLGWTAGVNRRSVAELSLGLMLSLLRKIPSVHSMVVNGGWKQVVGTQLSHKTVGIIGCGNVGADLVTLLKPFDCKILVNDIVSKEAFCRTHQISQVSLLDLLKESDVISVHVPLDASSKGLLDRTRLGLLKSTAILINAARGGIVDEVALADLLRSGKIGGAAFDVFGVEPPVGNELLKCENFIATPHIGGSTEESVLAMGRAAISGLDSAVSVDRWLEEE